ncbi:MAG: anti-sigma factor [Chloroflexota bacterium]
MPCDPVRELLEAHALGALDADERARVETHLATCADCARIADEYARVVAMLPHALAAVSPLPMPAALKSRVLRRVTAPPQPRASAHAPIRAWFGWPRWRTVGALATLVLLVGAVVWALQLNTALAQERALRAEYANLVGQQETVLEVIDSTKTNKALLRAVNGSNAYGKLYTRPDLPNVVVMAARLPQPPTGQSYRLWLTRDGQMQSPGALAINAQGFGIIVFDAGNNGPAYQKAQLVIQPDSSTTPDGALILLWDGSK